VTLQKGFLSSWRAWMQHRANGTADTAEGIAAYEQMKVASAAYAGERAARSEIAEAHRNAAVDDAGPESDLGLADAVSRAA